MDRVRATFGAGLLAVCILVSCSSALGASVAADLRNSGDFDTLGKDGTTSVYAYSKQRDVVNDDVRTIVKSNGIEIGARAESLANDKITVLGKDGTKEVYGPPVVALRKQKKSLMKKAGDGVQVQSETGRYLGAANQNVDTDGAKRILALAREEGVGKPPPGRAAAAAYDPFAVPAGLSFDYAPTIGARLQLDDAAVSGAVMFYALDSSVYLGDLDNFIEDGSAFTDTLWTLTLAATGPLGGPSAVEIEFVLNPAALREIPLPSAYLASLPGYSTGLSDAQVAALVDAAIESALALAMTFDNGAASLHDVALFPTGTRFLALGAGVIYAEGATAVLSSVPEPATVLLVAAGLLVMGWPLRPRIAAGTRRDHLRVAGNVAES